MTDFEHLSAELNDLLCVLNLLNWDARTQMPPGGSVTRAQQAATLSRLAQEKLLSPAFERAARDALQARPGDRAAGQALAAAAALRRVPAPLTGALASLKGEAQDAWASAKARSDFGAFAPYLERMVQLSRDLADALGYEDHPYDALLNLYEPGLTTAQLTPLFDRLRAHHVPLLRAIGQRPEPRSDFLTRAYPVAEQRAFSLGLAQAFGYDLSRGRLDESAHPFEISFTRQDVRITTRYQESFLPGALFGTLHETGHALYEQGVAPELTRTALASDLLGLYAVGGASFGTHESQSRLWENRVGRAQAFWTRHYPALRAHFPEQLADVTADEFYRAVNRVHPTLIRVEADELTYDLHIMLRVHLETQLISGDLSVRDLPDAWNARMKTDLGLDVPDDARGVLQDIHWSTGYFGSFPTYTVGNVMAAQFYQAAQAALPDLDADLAAGTYAPLQAWLTEQIYRHGRTFTPHELLVRVTGQGLDETPYLTYLTDKFSTLYGLK
ncbi:carboxypeptidase M32 [Deinococcus kurensis]|uniref:carboxypeptidase M32 n=1 Tax=Deinococcus kurensis TaxID=2662757 RepID=UPI0012D2F7BC|nr:carboxypeptidase M32 [Deinococcus kurensis]